MDCCRLLCAGVAGYGNHRVTVVLRGINLLGDFVLDFLLLGCLRYGFKLVRKATTPQVLFTEWDKYVRLGSFTCRTPYLRLDEKLAG